MLRSKGRLWVGLLVPGGSRALRQSVAARLRTSGTQSFSAACATPLSPQRRGPFSGLNCIFQR